MLSKTYFWVSEYCWFKTRRHGVPGVLVIAHGFGNYQNVFFVALGMHRADGAGKHIIGQADGQANDVWARRVRDTICRPCGWPRGKRNDNFYMCTACHGCYVY